MNQDNHQPNLQNTVKEGIESGQEFARTAFAKLFELILNQALSMDEMQGIGFRMLDEKVIQLTFTDLKQTFFIVYQLPDETASQVDQKSARLGSFTVQTHLMGSADAHIKTNMVDWLKHRTEAEGELATAFLAALYTIDIDWEEHLSHYVGDFIAFNLGQTARSAKSGIKTAKQKAGVTLKEYLQFEINLLPTEIQVAHFNQDVDEIAEEIDALAARVDKLTKSDN